MLECSRLQAVPILGDVRVEVTASAGTTLPSGACVRFRPFTGAWANSSRSTFYSLPHIFRSRLSFRQYPIPLFSNANSNTHKFSLTIHAPKGQASFLWCMSTWVIRQSVNLIVITSGGYAALPRLLEPCSLATTITEEVAEGSQVFASYRVA